MSLPPFLLTPTAPTPLPSQARLKALYASTSSQLHSNPTGYAANLQWWTSVLDESLRSGWTSSDHFLLSINDDLLGRFENAEGGRPKGLGGVIDSMVVSSKLYPLGPFLSNPIPIRHPGSLTYRFLGRPLLWGLSKVNPFGTSGETVEKEEALWRRHNGKEYVHLPLLERAAGIVTKYLEENPPLDYSDSLYTFTSFRETFGSIAIPPPSTTKPTSATSAMEKSAGEPERLSERDVEVLIRWLSRDTGLLLSDGSVVKIATEGMEEEITEADRGTITILSTIKTVEKQVESITSQITQCTLTAKTRLHNSQKSLALSTLRQKKSLEEILSKRLSTLLQLQSVLTSINTAQSDLEIMKAYQTGTSTLKSVLTNPLLDLGTIERTTEELADVLAGAEEVDEAVRVGGKVAVGGGAGEGVDEEELERELEGLVLEEKERQAAETEAEEKKGKEKADRVESKRREDEARQKAQEAQGREKEKAREKESREEKVQGGSGVGQAVGARPDSRSDWQSTFDAAQQRKSEEAQRAEIERLRREEKRVAAE